MLLVLWWYVIIQAVGLVALPLVYRCFDRLPDRGYGFARPLGVLGTSYALWLLTTLGFLRNRWGGVAGCACLVGLLGWWFYRRVGAADEPAVPLRAWLAHHRPLILACEALFAAAFLGFALFRAYNPEIVATEKPMELAFLNAILRSDTFPPHDPWLSGFAISYYYFGYLMMAMLTRLSSLPSGITFNLMQATVFAWTVTGAFSLGYNLVTGACPRAESLWQRLAYGGLAAWMTAVMGNLEGLLEVLHARGVGSTTFWEWLDIKGLAEAPRSAAWYPTDNWWWWRASRVIHDRTLLGQDQEVIDEFPAFSFLLGDMHPHVLALPFLLLAFALALQLLRARHPLRGSRLVLAGLLLGALGFLNTWDYPLVLALAVMAYALGRWAVVSAPVRSQLREIASTALALLLVGLAAYFPFYLSFQSQAGGVGLVLFERTRIVQYGIMFGPFLVILTAYLACELWAVWAYPRQRGEWLLGLGALAFILACLSFGHILPALLALFVTVGALIGWRWLRRMHQKVSASDLLALCLILVGLILTASVEFVFLRDTFGTRMNTVFKFYYQAWACFSVAGAYGVHAVLRRAGRWAGYAFSAALAVVLGIALVYPVTAVTSKANGFRGQPTLDGTAHLAGSHPDDYAAIQWLNDHVQGAPVLAEANGGSYTYAARISTHTGLPTLLGWGGHELQWRGNYEEPGRREPDIRSLYTARDPSLALTLLENYDITYVCVGDLEREAFGPVLTRFDRFMDPVFQQGGMVIYQRRP